MVPREVNSGSGRRRPLFQPKGRNLDPSERAAVVTLLGEGPHQRSLLIEYLHLIQDAEGCLPAGHLHGLADLLRVPMAEVYEVASFYAHFDIVLDGEDAPPRVTVRVCDSLSCMMAGGEALIAELNEQELEGVRVVASPCMGACDVAPACQVNRRQVGPATIDRITDLIERRDFGLRLPDFQSLAGYQAEGGYSLLTRCRHGGLSFDDIVGMLSRSGLRGLGGAGFPTGRKWSLVRSQPGPRVLAVNADEGEPGTFKDRSYLETRPHQFLEGALIAAWAVEATDTYIYVRDEYPAAIEILHQEIARIRKSGFVDHTTLHIRRGAGAYICGEESAMIESIEGKKGWPRHRPPYVAQVGVFGRPTLVNNVETLYWVPEILARGCGAGGGNDKDAEAVPRSYSVSGRIAAPGVVVAPAGMTVRDLIDRCGGMAAGHTFKGYLPGGASGGILPASLGDLPLDFGTIEEHGGFVGSHAVVVLSDHDNMRDVVRNLMAFFRHESCGQCTPCRNGTDKAVRLMANDLWDGDVLSDLAQVMRDASICGLGQAAPNAFEMAMKYFPEDFRQDATPKPRTLNEFVWGDRS